VGYRTIYDIAAEGYKEWPYIIFSLALFAVCAGLYVYLKRKRKSLLFFYAALVLSCIFALVSCGMTYWDYSRLKAALEENRCQITEGEVSEYWTRVITTRERMRSTRTWESFKVGNVQFGYYREVVAAGFRNAGKEAFLLRDGMKLRIHYVSDQLLDADGVENRILKLEAAE
jgi:hypothetical protein